MQRKVTLGMLEREAAKLGATVEEDVGGWVDCRVTAPTGKVWACDGDIHELCASANKGPKEWGWAMRADLLDRMAYGLIDCTIEDCDWCAERRNVNLEG